MQVASILSLQFKVFFVILQSFTQKSYMLGAFFGHKLDRAAKVVINAMSLY